MQNLLDCVPSGLHQEMVDQGGLCGGSTAGSRRRDAAREAVALSRLQSPQGHAAQGLPLLVREGAGTQVSARTSALLMWAVLL